MTSLEKVDRKIKRLASIEASYRNAVKRAEEVYRRNTLDSAKAKKRYERVRAKYGRRIEKIPPKVRQLRLERRRLKEGD